MSLRLLQNERLKKNTNHNHGSGATAFTAGYWVKPIGSTAFTGDDITNHNGLLRHRGNTGNVPQERIWTDPSGVLSLSSSVAFTNDAWNFVVVTSSQAGGQKVYLNGVEVASASVLEPMATIANTIDYLGDGAATGVWDTGDSAYFGGIFRIAGKALSEAEVQALYANRSGGGGTAKPQDHIATGVTVSCAAFDQTSGTVTNGDAGLADLGDVGNAWITNTGTPSWVNDDPGHTWSAEEPPAVEGEDVPSVVQAALSAAVAGGDLAWVAWGDSFNQILDARHGHSLHWASTVLPPVTGFAQGHSAGNAARQLRVLTAQEATGTNVKFEATGSTTYLVMNREVTPSRHGVPIETIGEWFCDNTLTLVSGTQFSRYDARSHRIGGWGERVMFQPGRKLKVRLRLLGAVSGKQLPDIKLVDPNGTLDQEFALTVDGCQSNGVTGTALEELLIGATYPDVTIDPTGTYPNIEYQVSVQKGTTDPVGSDKYLDLGGLVAYQVDETSGERIPGTHWINYAGNSWDLIHLVTDAQSTEETSKSFTDEQLLADVYATCIDPDQQVVIAINYAIEAATSGTIEDYAAKITAIVARLDSIYNQVYTNPPLYYFIVPMVHAIGATSYANLVTRFTNVTKALNAAATAADSRVSYVSIASRMGYRFATLTAGAVRDAYTAWALSQGWGNVTIIGLGTGNVTLQTDTDLLVENPGELHVDNPYAAAVLAQLALEPIAAAVAADEPPTYPGNGVHIASIDVGASWAALAESTAVMDLTIVAGANNTDPVAIRVNGGDAADMAPGDTIELRGADLSAIEVSGSDGDFVLVAGNTRGGL